MSSDARAARARVAARNSSLSAIERALITLSLALVLGVTLGVVV